MVTWVWEELIKVDIPEGWTVSDSPDLIEVLPPEPVGALQISIFRVPVGDIHDLCVRAVHNFVEKQAGRLRGDLQLEKQDNLTVVSGKFDSGQSEQSLSWLIAAFGWSGKIALATYCFGKGHDKMVQEAEGILASISLAN